MKSNNMMYLAVAAGAFLVLKSRDSGNGKTARAKHPAFTYARTETLSGDQEMELLKKLLVEANFGGVGSLDGNPITPEQFKLATMLMGEAINYYRNRPEKRLEKTRDMIIQRKEQILKPYYDAQKIGMGPISGFSGVY